MPKYIHKESKPYKEHLKPIFLEKFRKYGTVYTTCEAVGVCRQTIENWRSVDTEFDRAFKEIDATIVEIVEKRLIEMATKRNHHRYKAVCEHLIEDTEKDRREHLNGKVGEKCNHTHIDTVPCELGADPGSVRFYLQARDPRYRQRISHDVNVSVIKQSVVAVAAIIRNNLKDTCPHCHGLLDIKADLVKQLGYEAEKMEKEG